MTKTNTVSLKTVICNTIINLLSDIRKGRVQYWGSPRIFMKDEIKEFDTNIDRLKIEDAQICA